MEMKKPAWRRFDESPTSYTVESSRFSGTCRVPHKGDRRQPYGRPAADERVPGAAVREARSFGTNMGTNR